MAAINDLAAQLAKITADAVAVLDLRSAGLDGLPEEIAHRLGRSASSDRERLARRPSAERIEQAVAAVRNCSRLDFRDVRYAGYGCGMRSRDGYCMLGDHTASRHLLDTIAAETDQRAFRRLYAPLLNSYFTADRYAEDFDAQMRAGLETVRAFLQAHQHRVTSIDPRTNWADALHSRSELLSQSPGATFAQDWLKGETRAFTSTLEQLRIVGTSWLAGDVVRAALDLAVKGSDAAFASRIETFLKASAEARFLALRGEIYATLLTRYAACNGARPHDRLRDAVIGAWQAPWLLKNQAAWGRVSETTRKMVEGWLKLELIHQFFDVLSEDGKQDRRRFEFWRSYHEQMDAVYFALSPEAYRSRGADLIKLKEALDGRLLQYVGGTANTHAFIMYIGERAIVEFSMTRNAAYFYDKRDLTLEGGRTEVPNKWLKRKPVGLDLRHTDAKAATWEERFREAISGTPKTRALRSEPPRSVPGKFGTMFHSEMSSRQSSAATATEHAKDRDSVLGYLRANGIAFDDRRQQGGRLLVDADDTNVLLNDILLAWGFRYASGRGWWRAD